MSDYIERYTGILALLLFIEIAVTLCSEFSELCRWVAVILGIGLAVPIGLWYKHLFADV